MSGKARAKFTTGKMTTLISTYVRFSLGSLRFSKPRAEVVSICSDATFIEQAAPVLHQTWANTLIVIVALALLINTLGVSALVGFAVGLSPLRAD